MLGFVRGGQVQLHQLRMAKQIIKSAVIFALSFGIVTSCVLLLYWQKEVNFMASLVYKQAYIYDFFLPDHIVTKFTVNYKDLIMNNPKYFLADYYFIRNDQKFNDLLQTASIYGFMSGLVVMLMVFFYWRMYAKKYSINQDSSKEILSTKDVNYLLSKEDKLSDLKLGDAHMVKNKETSHILVSVL